MSFPLHYGLVCKRINGSIVLTVKVKSRPFVSQLYCTVEQQVLVSLNKQKDATSSQASATCTAADVKDDRFAFD